MEEVTTWTEQYSQWQLLSSCHDCIEALEQVCDGSDQSPCLSKHIMTVKFPAVALPEGQIHFSKV